MRRVLALALTLASLAVLSGCMGSEETKNGVTIKKRGLGDAIWGD